MSVSESDKECPLCMETLDWDDLGFFPCSCGYQICRFCWHRLRTDENGLCPACRQTFPDMPVSFNPEISAEELKKQKKRNKERKSHNNQVFKPQDLATLRVVQKNLVFVIGLSSRLTQEDLKKEFAHFGKIIKFVHNKSTAYITYSKPEEAIRAIRTLNASAAHETSNQQLQFQNQISNGTTTSALGSPTLSSSATTNSATGFLTTNQTALSNNLVSTNGTILSNTVMNLNTTGSKSFLNAMSVSTPPNRLKASLGTTKYCNHFLRSQQCPKVGECMYLHEIAEAEASFTKEQMQAGKHVEYERKLMDSYLSRMDWQSNQLASQNNGYRFSRDNLPGTQPQPPNQQQNQMIATATQQQATQSIANQPQPPHQHQLQHQASQYQIHHQLQSNLTATISHQINNIESACQQQGISIVPKLQQQILDQSQANPLHSRTQQPDSQHTILHSLPWEGSILNSLKQRHQPVQEQHQQHIQQQQLIQQQHQQLVIDSDSDDDGLDFDPISISTSGLRELLDQQVQQAKQLQMQNYIQQMSNGQSLASVLFQHTASNGLDEHHHSRNRF